MAKSRVTLTINDSWSLVVVEDEDGELTVSIKDDTKIEDTLDIQSNAMRYTREWINRAMG